MRDVLWWLAGDAWAVERARGDREVWAATYGYPPTDAATARLFERHTRQTACLAALLGRSDYARLVALYDADIITSRGR